jgi:hypothetical protein
MIPMFLSECEVSLVYRIFKAGRSIALNPPTGSLMSNGRGTFRTGVDAIANPLAKVSFGNRFGIPILD